jgi:RNA-binding protein
MHLTGKQRRYLRAQGHALKPVIRIGKQGLAPAVLTQLDEVLTSHELVKVKLLENCPVPLQDCAEQLANGTHAAVAQTVGHTILLYRAHPEHPVLVLPAGADASESTEADPTAEPKGVGA